MNPQEQLSALAEAHAKLPRADIRPGGEPTLELKYEELYVQFEKTNGQIVKQFFADHLVAAAVVTEPPVRRIGPFRFFGGSTAPILHITTQALAGQDARAFEILLRCRTLSLRAQLALPRSQALGASELVFPIVTALLGILDRQVAHETEGPGLLTRYVSALDSELARAEEYVEQTAFVYEQRNYASGVLVGLGLLVVAVLAVELAAGKTPFADDAAIAIVAGAVGASVSVIQRLALKRAGEPQLGGASTLLLGSLRPGFGAAAGAAVYFLLQYKVLIVPGPPPIALYSAAAFIAGFAERLAPDVFESRSRLGAIGSPTARSTQEAIERIQATVQESILTTLQGPQLARWRGYVGASVRGARESAGTSLAQQDQALALAIHFGSSDARGAVNRVIDIREGVQLDPVPFQVHVDSDAILFPPEDTAVAVPVDGDAEVDIPFIAPNATGEHHAWVYVSQHNRTIQIIPFVLQVVPASP